MNATEPDQSPVSAVVVLRADGAALFQHRDDKPGLRHRGLWAFPGGHCDPGEDPLDGAKRELLEETRLAFDHLQFLVTVTDSGGGTFAPYPLHLYVARYEAGQAFECLEGQELRFIERGDASQFPIVAPQVEYWDLALQLNSRSKSLP